MLWSDDLDGMIPLCRDFETRLIKLVWRARGTVSAAPSELSSTSPPSEDDFADKAKESADPIAAEHGNQAARAGKGTSLWKLLSWRSTRSAHVKDMESAAPKKRQTRLIAPFYNGLGCALAIRTCVLGARVLR